MSSRIKNGLFGNRRDEQFAQRLAQIESASQPGPSESLPPAATGPVAGKSQPDISQPDISQPDKSRTAPERGPATETPAAAPQTKSPAGPQTETPEPVRARKFTEQKAAGSTDESPQAKAGAPTQALAKKVPPVLAAPVPDDGSNDPIEQVRDVARAALPSVLVFSVIINLLMLTGPLFMLQVYDRALPSGNVSTLVILFVLVAFLYLFFALLDGVRGRVFIRLGTRVDEILHRPVYNALLRLSGRDPAAAGPQPLRDLDSVRGYVSGPGPSAFFDLPWVPVYLGLIFFMHPILGIFSVIAASILVTVAILNKRLTQQGHGEVARATYDAQRFAEEGRRDAPAAQALGMQPSLVDEWTRRKGEAIGLMRQTADRSGLFTSASKSLRLFFQSAMLGLGAWLAIEQLITAGMIIAATIIMSRALAPIEQTIQQWPSFAGAQRAWERLKELFAKMPAEPARRTALPAPTGAIQVANLSCFAPGAARPVIAGIDFDLGSGAGLGVIGPSGVGKSTLVKAILGIWPNFNGDVRLDGADHNQWDPATLGRYLGYLPQQATLLPGTVAQNISRFDPDADSAAILNAARITGAHQLAVSLPDGYDTMVGAEGVQLSSGQIQRLALARAVYGMPPIVVLDEPYSNLDSDGEHALTETIRAMREFGSTVIVVTHRSSALNALDTILCLRDGRQAFYGPKDEVLHAMTQAVAAQGPAAPQERITAEGKSKRIHARPRPQAQEAEGAVKPDVEEPGVVRPSANEKPEHVAASDEDQARLEMIRRKQAELQAKIAGKRADQEPGRGVAARKVGHG